MSSCWKGGGAKKDSRTKTSECFVFDHCNLSIIIGISYYCKLMFKYSLCERVKQHLIHVFTYKSLTKTFERDAAYHVEVAWWTIVLKNLLKPFDQCVQMNTDFREFLDLRGLIFKIIKTTPRDPYWLIWYNVVENMVEIDSFLPSSV